jgi:hypothetical protein
MVVEQPDGTLKCSPFYGAAQHGMPPRTVPAVDECGPYTQQPVPRWLQQQPVAPQRSVQALARPRRLHSPRVRLTGARGHHTACFAVRFGKYTPMRAKDKVVRISVNGEWRLLPTGTGHRWLAAAPGMIWACMFSCTLRPAMGIDDFAHRSRAPRTPQARRRPSACTWGLTARPTLRPRRQRLSAVRGHPHRQPSPIPAASIAWALLPHVPHEPALVGAAPAGCATAPLSMPRAQAQGPRQCAAPCIAKLPPTNLCPAVRDESSDQTPATRTTCCQA